MDDVRDLSMPAVESEITALAGHLAAATCRFLELVAAFDDGGGWRGHGLRSCAQWLSWRCGLSPSAAHEQLRVGHALTGLPAVRGAFAAGRISYSKARALTRVATPDDERSLVDVATGCTAAQLDRHCAGLARARGDVQVLGQAARAGFTSRFDPDGTFRFSGRLSADDGAILLAALSAVTPPAVVEDDSTPGGCSAAVVDAGGRGAADDAAALLVLARHAIADPPTEIGPQPVRLTVHTTTTEPVLRGGVDRADGFPASAGVLRGGVDNETRPVAVLDAGPGITPIPLSPTTFRRLTCEALVEHDTDTDTEHDTETAAGTGTGAGPAASRRRFADRRQRRALLRRDGGCAFPGCPRRRHLHAHHLQHWADGGPTTTDNMALVCPHHHLLLHEGHWQLRRDGTHWTAIDPHGREHPTAPPVHGTPELLAGMHAAHLDPDTITGTWHGERLHLAYAIGVLLEQPVPAAA